VPNHASEDALLDAEVARSLYRLHGEQATDFCDHRKLPTGIKCWLRQTELRDVHGLLIAALHRWHQLRE